MKKYILRHSMIALMTAFTGVLAACQGGSGGSGIDWIKQYGSGAGKDDTGDAVFAGRDIYFAGYTLGTITGQQDYGIFDAFVTSYTATGKLAWQRQFGTSQDSYARGVFADDSGVYAAGSATGAFPGNNSAGNIDAFVYKMDSAGHPVWVRQFGGPQNDYAYAVTGRGGSIYIAGVTFGALPGQEKAGSADIFLMKMDPAGNEIWTRQFGSMANDYTYSLCADDSGIYVAGFTYGQIGSICGLGGAEAFVRKYDFQGKELWSQMWGTAVNDYANAVAVGEDGIYVLGITYGDLGEKNRGGADIFLSKLSPGGEILWTRQAGTASTDFGWGVAVAGGKAYISGYTSGAFEGQVNAGQYDAYAAAFDGSGNMLWVHEFGTPKDDYLKGVSAGAGGVYISGTTWGSFSARQGNDSDTVAIKLAK